MIFSSDLRHAYYASLAEMFGPSTVEAIASVCGSRDGFTVSTRKITVLTVELTTGSTTV